MTYMIHLELHGDVRNAQLLSGPGMDFKQPFKISTPECWKCFK